MTLPVNFPIAKLLKEKNIKIDTEEVLFYRDEVNNIEEHQIKNRDVLYNYTGFGDYITDENEYQTYMIADVVMWMYEKHGIWISVFEMERSEDWSNYFDYSIKQKKISLVDISKKLEEFNNPTEAYEAAIEYTLNNLI